MSGYREDARRGMAARLHEEDGPPKQMAARVGVTDRSVRRWRSVQDTKGSPAYRLSLWMENHPDPFRLLAYVQTLAFQHVREESNEELVAKTRELFAKDSETEGLENSARFTDINLLDHAALCERDARDDLELAARLRECAARRLNWREATR